jgi:hypothetical protein
MGGNQHQNQLRISEDLLPSKSDDIGADLGGIETYRSVQ